MLTHVILLSFWLHMSMFPMSQWNKNCQNWNALFKKVMDHFRNPLSQILLGPAVSQSFSLWTDGSRLAPLQTLCPWVSGDTVRLSQQQMKTSNFTKEGIDCRMYDHFWDTPRMLQHASGATTVIDLNSYNAQWLPDLKIRGTFGTNQVFQMKLYLIVGPKSFSASVGSSICRAFGWCSQASSCTGETEGSSIGGETQKQLLSWCTPRYPVGQRSVLSKSTKTARFFTLTLQYSAPSLPNPPPTHTQTVKWTCWKNVLWFCLLQCCSECVNWSPQSSCTAGCCVQ